MTIDNDTQLAVFRPLNEVMGRWSDNSDFDDLNVLAIAIADSSRKYASALKRKRMDEALGLAVKLDAYASKLQQFTKHIAQS